MQQKFKKLFFVFQIIAFELVGGNSLNSEENTCHRLSTKMQQNSKFPKLRKFHVDIKNATKIQEIIFRFSDNCV